MNSEKKHKQPNILLIEADQMASGILPIFNPEGQAIVPNLTKLADEGIVFENCYCNSPLCSPSRVAMFTGLRTSHNHVWGNGSEFTSDKPTMMHYLKHAGYRTVVSGKTHFVGADQLHGFDKRLATDIYPSDFNWSIDWLPQVEHRPGTSVNKLKVSGLCKVNNQILYDEEVHFRAKEFIRMEAMEKKDSPFFFHVSYTQPHESYQTTPEFWDLYEDVDIELPKQAADSDEEMHQIAKWLRIHHGIDQFPPSDELIIASRRAYYAMTTQIDAYIGELVAELKRLDLYDNTIIIFTSDHGDMMGERGMWFKRSPYDWSSKVPMIIHYPKEYAPRREKQVISHIDLCPTISHIGSGDKELNRYGNEDSHSFHGLLEEKDAHWKDEAIFEYYGPGVEQPWLAIRRRDWKYVFTRNNEPLLFNMIDDPLEVNNLADDPRFADLMAELHAAVHDDIDVDALTEQAINSKQTRIFLHEALKDGEEYKWDYQPVFDATKQYVRGVNKPSFC
jgi:choline-sulfatase